MDRNTADSPLTSYRTYAWVWAALVTLLATTVTVAKMNLFGEYSVLASLLISSCQAGLSLFFFMHLKDEGRFLKVMLLVAVSTLTLIICLTFMDVWYR
jgi:cytochrome c oxidase subunit 4